MSTPEPIVWETEITVSLFPEDDVNTHAFEATVEYRGRGLWAVCHHGRCLSRDGGWDHEAKFSWNRTQEFLATHRFPKDEAIELAKEALRRAWEERKQK